MTNRANIFYDHEIETLIRERSTGILPLISYVFEQYPSASLNDIFFTVESHVRAFGLDSYPEGLLRAPKVQDDYVPAPVAVPVEEPEVEEVAVKFDTREDVVEISEKEDKARIIRRRTPEKPRDQLNVRGIMDDIDGLNL